MTRILPKVHSATELLANPDLLKPPAAVVPRFLYRHNVTLLAGREKEGKSTLATALAASVSSGRPFLGEPVIRGPVLWLRLEEPIGTLLRRLVQFKANTDNIHIPDQLPNGPDDVPALIASTTPVVVVVDTLTALSYERVKDPYNAIEWTRVLKPIADAAQAHHSAVLVLHHARRSDGKYRDSSGIGANADFILEMQLDASDDTVRAFDPKGRWTIPPFRIKLDANGTTYQTASHEAEHEARVLAHIAGAPGEGMRSLRKAVGGRVEKTDEALTRLIATGRVVDLGNAGGRALWLSEACPGAGTRSERDTAVAVEASAA